MKRGEKCGWEITPQATQDSLWAFILGGFVWSVGESRKCEEKKLFRQKNALLFSSLMQFT